MLCALGAPFVQVCWPMRGVLVVLVSLGMSSVLAAQVVVPAKLSLADALRLADERSPDPSVDTSKPAICGQAKPAIN